MVDDIKTPGFQEQIYAVENAARKVITEKLDEVNKIVFYDESQDRDIADEDPLYDLPAQHSVDKYDKDSCYRIIKIYKGEEGYFATGLCDDSFTELRYEFNLFEDVDSTVIAEIADLLNK